MTGVQIAINRGDVIEVDLWGAKGGEKKNDPGMIGRLCVVVQNEGGNRGPLTIVAPITNIGQFKGYRMQVEVCGEEQRGPLHHDSTIECGHLRSIDQLQRVKRNVGPLPPATMLRVDAALYASLGLAFPAPVSN